MYGAEQICNIHTYIHTCTYILPSRQGYIHAHIHAHIHAPMYTAHIYTLTQTCRCTSEIGVGPIKDMSVCAE